MVGAGKAFLAKIETTPDVFTQVGGCRSVGNSYQTEAIDVTSMDSDEWKEVLDEAGVRSFASSCAGILKSTAPIATIRTAMLAQTLKKFRFYDINGYWEGLFKITSFEMTGEYNGAQQFSMKLESSGTIVFT